MNLDDVKAGRFINSDQPWVTRNSALAAAEPVMWKTLQLQPWPSSPMVELRLKIIGVRRRGA